MPLVRTDPPLLPPDPATLPALRAQAAADGDDRRMMALRELELACGGLPPVVDGVRRERLLAVDPLATTWEGWEIEGGGRTMLRCLHPRWLDDPVMRRRLAAPLPTGLPDALAVPTRAHLDGDWPHLWLAAPGLPIVDRLPVEDPPDRIELARLLGTGLTALDALHRAGRNHGGPMATHLFSGPDGVQLAWLDRFGAADDGPAHDLRRLGRLIAALDPHGADPVAGLAWSWTEDPPPSAADGLVLLRRTLAGDLLAARHQLALAGRRVGRQDRAGRLSQLARRLQTSVAPPALPAGRACLKATITGSLFLVESDGRVVRGGAVPALAGDPAVADLPALFHPRFGLDAQVARTLLRAWASRARGDEVQRARVQDQLGSRDAHAQALVRWLRAMAALRRSRMMLEHQARPVHQAPLGHAGAPT